MNWKQSMVAPIMGGIGPVHVDITSRAFCPQFVFSLFRTHFKHENGTLYRPRFLDESCKDCFDFPDIVLVTGKF